MRAVIDTNCILASIPPKGDYYWLYESFEKGLFDWVISNEILTEYDEKISERYSRETAHLVITILLFAPNTILAEPYFRWQLIESDPDDNKFFDLSIAAEADYLVTNDRDFDVVKKVDFPKVNIVSLTEFKLILEL
ncbi:putative toxin-antitoxin system toxin component, PIN family [Persicitalea sp.]|uniref:putative toxin-antitoxin system toxin component, PIN family n=1 Tax=Persicitalea sp. TaxID=3100273 RepID=UPI0035943A4A